MDEDGKIKRLLGMRVDDIAVSGKGSGIGDFLSLLKRHFDISSDKPSLHFLSLGISEVKDHKILINQAHNISNVQKMFAKEENEWYNCQMTNISKL